MTYAPLDPGPQIDACAPNLLCVLLLHVILLGLEIPLAGDRQRQPLDHGDATSTTALAIADRHEATPASCHSAIDAEQVDKAGQQPPHAGTAEPLRISPPLAVAYLLELTGNNRRGRRGQRPGTQSHAEPLGLLSSASPVQNMHLAAI